MRYHDDDEAPRLNAAAWQLDLLKLNPEYLSWGPHEDYMINDKEHSWASRQILPTWAEFGSWHLDCLNECVNFYFAVERASQSCSFCGGNGLHPDAHWVSESFYSHSSPFKLQTPREVQATAVMRGFGIEERRVLDYGSYPSAELLAKYGDAFTAFCEGMRSRGHWSNDITEDEATALMQGGRAKEGETAAQINAREVRGGMACHDAINRYLLVKQRCARLGLPYDCPTCEGHGEVFTAPAAHVSLTLWWLHPRKGCSRGIEISRIEQAELPAVFDLLRAAAERNASRFSKIPAATTATTT